jgi:hypothetical protein
MLFGGFNALAREFAQYALCGVATRWGAREGFFIRRRWCEGLQGGCGVLRCWEWQLAVFSCPITDGEDLQSASPLEASALSPRSIISSSSSSLTWTSPWPNIPRDGTLGRSS